MAAIESNSSSPLPQASYALGYNLAIEYLADYEKTWMLDSFRALDGRIFAGLGKKVDWVFLEVHAEGECCRRWRRIKATGACSEAGAEEREWVITL